MNNRLKHALDALGYNLTQPVESRVALLTAVQTFARTCADEELAGACSETLGAVERGSEGRISDADVGTAEGVIGSVLEALRSGTARTGNEDLDRMLDLVNGGTPVEQMRRVFEGCGSREDLDAVKLYVRLLEEFRRNPTLDYEIPEPGQVPQVGSHVFCPPDAIEGDSRDFTVTVYQDRSALWLDEQGRQTARQDKNLVLKTVLGDHRAGKALQREIDEFTVETTISDEAYWAIVELEAVMAQGWEGTSEMVETIDRALTPCFWRDVNSFLPAPLKRQ